MRYIGTFWSHCKLFEKVMQAPIIFGQTTLYHIIVNIACIFAHLIFA